MPTAEVRQRRHQQRQQPRREAECQARHAAVKYVEQARNRHVSPAQAARHLGLAPRTLRDWKRRQRFDPFTSPPRGRPPRTAPVDVRNQVIRFLHEVTGPAVGLPALRALFPQIPRCLLEDLLRRYRRAWRRRYVQRGFQLQWHRPGAVWAMDHSQAPQPIDGVYPYVFAVRDLPSHRQLTWQGVEGQTAEEVLPILRALFTQYGPPLVLKSDNGSAFIADITQAAMLEEAVAQLFSPARRPQYNGALERSNGTLKTYTHQRAIRAGHPFRWTSDDLEHARQLANTLSRPWGHRGPSPEEAWQSRAPISLEEQARFQEALASQRARASQDLGLVDSCPLSSADAARRDRLAVSRTLEELGYLTKRRVRRPPRKPPRLRRHDLARRAAEQRQTPRAVRGTMPAAVVAPSSSAPVIPAIHERQMLASSPSPVTIHAVGVPEDIFDTPTDVVSALTPARREWAFTSWLRRLITPLLNSRKAAKIS